MVDVREYGKPTYMIATSPRSNTTTYKCLNTVLKFSLEGYSQIFVLIIKYGIIIVLQMHMNHLKVD